MTITVLNTDRLALRKHSATCNCLVLQPQCSCPSYMRVHQTVMMQLSKMIVGTCRQIVKMAQQVCYMLKATTILLQGKSQWLTDKDRNKSSCS